MKWYQYPEQVPELTEALLRHFQRTKNKQALVAVCYTESGITFVTEQAQIDKLINTKWESIVGIYNSQFVLEHFWGDLHFYRRNLVHDKRETTKVTTGDDQEFLDSIGKALESVIS